jgi:hypothetical protein
VVSRPAISLVCPFGVSDTFMPAVSTLLDSSSANEAMSQTSASFFFELKMNIFCASRSKMEVSIRSPTFVSDRMRGPLM